MHTLYTTALVIWGGCADRFRRTLGEGKDRGASTLELVILVLGLITVATLLVAALTAAVKSRTDQIS